MQLHRTTSCTAAGHREVTLQLAKPSPLPDLHRILIDYFEAAVSRGMRFLPNQTIQLGWSVLRLCERDDGTLGVEERALAPEVTWIEAVDRALADVWTQREIARSVGLADALAFPYQDDRALVANCVLEATELVMTRVSGDDLPAGFSGWMLACARDHDHGERAYVPLIAVATMQPALVQLLALPHDTSVLVVFRWKPSGPSGAMRIEPHIFRRGEEIIPAAGSYLAALQG
ncbi:MAG TPA: hypothetical protein VK427_10660 [Kofleriaceae bacterium]|nr:hypothetical protein [Kofleriaceae bacterium]